MASKLGKIIADFETQLSVKIAVGGSNVNLQSVLDDDGEYLPAGQYYFTIDGDNSSKEHILCTLSTPTALLSAISSVSRNGYVDITTFTPPNTPGVVREHRVGASVRITDFAHIKAINDLLDTTVDFDKDNPLKYDGDPAITLDAEFATKKYADDNLVGITGNQNVDGIKTFLELPVIPVLPLANTDACSKKYADDLAIAGAPDASLVVKGISEEATAAQIIAGTQVGDDTGAELFINPKYLKDAGITPASAVETLTPKPNFIVSGAFTIIAMAADNTVMKVGQVVIPKDIVVNKISFWAQSINVAGTCRLGLYSEDGAVLVVDVTTAAITINAVITTAVGAVSVPAGVYYVFIIPMGTANLGVQAWTPTAAEPLKGAIAGEPVLEGTVTVVDGSPEDAIVPSGVTDADAKTLYFRIDN